MQRKDFLRGFLGLAVSVPALTSMAKAIPQPETLPEVRNRVFTIKHIIEDNRTIFFPRTIMFPEISSDQMKESMYLTRRSGFVMYNSSKLKEPNYCATWIMDSDGLLAKGDVLEMVITHAQQAMMPQIWEVLAAESYTAPDSKNWQFVNVRFRHGDPRPSAPSGGATFVLIS